MEVRTTLVGRGLYEVATHAFVSAAAIENSGGIPDKHLEIHNPLTRDQQYLRSSIMPSHLLTVATNQPFDEDLVLGSRFGVRNFVNLEIWYAGQI